MTIPDGRLTWDELWDALVAAQAEDAMNKPIIATLRDCLGDALEERDRLASQVTDLTAMVEELWEWVEGEWMGTNGLIGASAELWERVKPLLADSLAERAEETT